MMKLKLEEEYSHKNFDLCVTYDVSQIHFTLFLLILLVLILFRVTNRFVCYFRLLKFTLRKNKLNTVYPSDSIQQERLPVSLEVSRTYF